MRTKEEVVRSLIESGESYTRADRFMLEALLEVRDLMAQAVEELHGLRAEVDAYDEEEEHVLLEEV